MRVGNMPIKYGCITCYIPWMEAARQRNSEQTMNQMIKPTRSVDCFCPLELWRIELTDVLSVQLAPKHHAALTYRGSEEGDVDKNKCCTLCNMSFTSAVVAQSHYQGKIHAKRLKLLLGEQPAITAKEAPPSPVKSSPETTPVTSPRQRRDSDRYCQLCNAWFNNPGMAQQHYDGKKHKKNAARADLLEQLGKTLDMGEMKGLKRSYTCEVCSVTLNSVAQYHAHLQGSKHQNNSVPGHTALDY
eukprot:XP_014026466.1 PREDICTED: zinc finger matrin-type protein 4 isoform X3 [Salmo salar]